MKKIHLSKRDSAEKRVKSEDKQNRGTARLLKSRGSEEMVGTAGA